MQTRPLYPAPSDPPISTLVPSQTSKPIHVSASNIAKTHANQIANSNQPVSFFTEEAIAEGGATVKGMVQSQQLALQVGFDGDQDRVEVSGLGGVGMPTGHGCQMIKGSHKDTNSRKKGKRKSPKKTQKNKKLSTTIIKTKNSNPNTSIITNIVKGPQYKTLIPPQRNPVITKPPQQKSLEASKPSSNKTQSEKIGLLNNNPCLYPKHSDAKIVDPGHKTHPQPQKQSGKPQAPIQPRTHTHTHAQYINDLQFNTLNSQYYKQSKNVSLLNVLAKSIEIGGKGKGRGRGRGMGGARGSMGSNNHQDGDRSRCLVVARGSQMHCECENCNVRRSLNRRNSSIDSYMKPESWHNQPLYKGDNHSVNNGNRYACIAQDKNNNNKPNLPPNLKSNSNSNLTKIENPSLTATNPETTQPQYQLYPKLQKGSQFHPNSYAYPCSYLQPHSHIQNQVPRTNSYRVFLKYLNTNLSAEYGNISNFCNQLHCYEQQQMQQGQGKGKGKELGDQQRELMKDQMREEHVDAQYMINKFGIKNTYNRQMEKISSNKSSDANTSQANSSPNLINKNKDTNILNNANIEVSNKGRSKSIKNSIYSHLIQNPKFNSNKNPQSSNHPSPNYIQARLNPQQQPKQRNEKELGGSQDDLGEAGLYQYQFKTDYQFFLGRYYEFIKNKRVGYARADRQAGSPQQQPAHKNEPANSSNISQHMHKSISEIRKSRKLKAHQLLSTTPQPKPVPKAHTQKNKTQQSNLQPQHQCQFSQLQSQLQSHHQSQYYQLQEKPNCGKIQQSSVHKNIKHLELQEQLLGEKLSGELGMDSRLGLSADQRVNINQYLDEDRYQKVRIRAINALKQLQSQSIVLGGQLDVQQRIRQKMETQFNQELKQIEQADSRPTKPTQSEARCQKSNKDKHKALKDVIKYRRPQSEQGKKSGKFFDSNDSSSIHHNQSHIDGHQNYKGNGCDKDGCEGLGRDRGIFYQGMFGDWRDYGQYMLGNQFINMNVSMNLNIPRIQPQLIQYPKSITLKFNKPQSIRQKAQNHSQDHRRQKKKLKDTIPKPNPNSSNNSISKIINNKSLFNQEISAQLTNQIKDKLRESRLDVGSRGSSLFGSYKGSRNRIKSESKWIYCNPDINSTYKHNPALATSTISPHNKPSTDKYKPRPQPQPSHKSPNMSESANITTKTTINHDKSLVQAINSNKGNRSSNNSISANSSKNKNGEEIMDCSIGVSRKGRQSSGGGSKGRGGKCGGNVNIMRVYQLG